MKTLFDYINQYIELSESDKEKITENCIQRKYLKGQYIVQQGDICKTENFVIRGCLKTFHIDENGKEHIVMFALENWWASDMGSFLNKTPADFNIQCLEKSEVIQFTRESLDILYEQIPHLERFFRIILQKAFIASEKRIVRNFSLNAKERYTRFIEQYPDIEQRVPQYMIASYLGMSKEFLSKIRKQFSEER